MTSRKPKGKETKKKHPVSNNAAIATTEATKTTKIVKGANELKKEENEARATKKNE